MSTCDQDRDSTSVARIPVATANRLTCRTAAGAGVSVTQGGEAYVYGDGANILQQPMQVAAATAPTHAMLLGQATGRLLGVTTYATVGTFTFTPNPLAKSWEIEVQGVGGGTGGVGTTVAGQSKIVPGGGAGGYAKSYITTPFASATVVVGAGGAPGNSTPTDGQNGGSSSFSPAAGTVMVATGGQGSQGQASPIAMPGQVGGPSGGTATGGNVFNVAGEQGGNAQAPRTSNGMSGKGGDSMFSFGGNARVGSAGAGLPGSYGSGASGPIAQDRGFENGGFGGVGLTLTQFLVPI